MKLPPHVVAVDQAYVTLGGDAGGLVKALKAQGYADAVGRDAQLRPRIAYRQPGETGLFCASLVSLLDWLSAQGAVFLEQYNAGDSPTEIMRALRAQGRVGPFQSLLIREPGDYVVEDSG